jgi:hypothetical protein
MEGRKRGGSGRRETQELWNEERRGEKKKKAGKMDEKITEGGRDLSALYSHGGGIKGLQLRGEK